MLGVVVLDNIESQVCIHARTHTQTHDMNQEPQHLETVNKWLVSNTYKCNDFSDLSQLYLSKKEETISLVLPTLNEEQTIEFIVTKILDTLNEEFKIIDEIIVIDTKFQKSNMRSL